MAMARSSTLSLVLTKKAVKSEKIITVAERMSSERVKVRVMMWKVVKARELRSTACSNF